MVLFALFFSPFSHSLSLSRSLARTFSHLCVRLWWLVGPMHNTESQIGYYEDFHFYCQCKCDARIYLMRIRIHSVWRRHNLFAFSELYTLTHIILNPKPHLPIYIVHKCVRICVCSLLHISNGPAYKIHKQT